MIVKVKIPPLRWNRGVYTTPSSDANPVLWVGEAWKLLFLALLLLILLYMYVIMRDSLKLLHMIQ